MAMNPREVNDLPETIRALLSEPGQNRRSLEARIRDCPALLTPEAQDIFSAIANREISRAGREYVQNIARVLARLQNESADAVFADEGLVVRQQAAKAARDARMEAAREAFEEWRKQTSTDVGTRDAEDLPSLSDVVSIMRSVAVNEEPLPYGRDVTQSDRPIYPAPSFVFRGESADYSTTHASMVRLRADAVISRDALDDMMRVSDFLVERFQTQLSMSRGESLGFLQHYGVPTELIDVTSDISVAISFASRLRVGDVGSVCIVPTKSLEGRGELHDLRRHPFARRPQRQSAFAVHLPSLPNLKSPEAIETLGLSWIRFRLTHVDAARFAPRFDLLDAHTDEVAGLIWIMIDDYGKFSDEAAMLLAQRIDPARLMARASSDGTVVLLPEDEASYGLGARYDDDEMFRRGHYEQWSNKFESPAPQLLPAELEQAVSTGPIEPGAILQILTARGIGHRVPPPRS
jgi:hypothetical protein